MIELKNISDSDLVGVIADDIEGIETSIDVEVACEEIVRRRKVKLASGEIKDGGRKFKPQLTNKKGLSCSQLLRRIRLNKRGN